MVEIPYFAHHSSAGIIAALPCLGRVIPRTRASNVWFGARFLSQRFLDISKRICRLVAWHNLRFVEPFPGWVTLVPFDGGFEEIYDVLVFDILRPVAGNVKGREAGRVLTEFVRPEIGVGSSLVDPVCVHPIYQVVSAECLEEGVDCRTFPRRYYCSVGQRVRCIWRRHRIILAAQIAVLGVRSGTVIRPQTMHCPRVFRNSLALSFQSCISAPKLGLEKEASKGLGTAAVDLGWVGARRA